MPEHKGHADAGLREYLIAYRSELRMLFTDTLLVGSDGAEWGKYAWRECSKGVDPLVAGEAVIGASLRAAGRAAAGDGRASVRLPRVGCRRRAGVAPCLALQDLGVTRVSQLIDNSPPKPR